MSGVASLALAIQCFLHPLQLGTQPEVAFLDENVGSVLVCVAHPMLVCVAHPNPTSVPTSYPTFQYLCQLYANSMPTLCQLYH